MATVYVVDYLLACIDFRNQQRHVSFGIRHRTDLGIQPSYLFQHVSIMARLQPHGCRCRGHQEGGWNTFSGYVGNDDLSGVRVDREIIVVIAAYTLDGCIMPAISSPAIEGLPKGRNIR
jgi:hypothetical protein